MGRSASRLIRPHAQPGDQLVERITSPAGAVEVLLHASRGDMPSARRQHLIGLVICWIGEWQREVEDRERGCVRLLLDAAQRVGEADALRA